MKGDYIAIKDNGPGLPAKTIKSVLDYSIRVSSREGYASPTRGAQGNALKTILPMAYVLDERHGEEASGKTVIEAHGIAHHIEFAVVAAGRPPSCAPATLSATAWPAYPCEKLQIGACFRPDWGPSGESELTGENQTKECGPAAGFQRGLGFFKGANVRFVPPVSFRL